MTPINIENINAGEILLNKLCFHFNKQAGYARIENCYKIHSDDKQELIRFINTKMEGTCDFNLRALNRIIKKTEAGSFKKKIPTSNATLRTLCFIVLKMEFPTMRLHTEENHGNAHAHSMYVTNFTNKFIDPLLSFAENPNLSRPPLIFFDSCWYLYINVVHKETGIRQTGRKILKFIKDDDQLKVEYISQNTFIPDWTGHTRFDSSTGYLLLNLNTSKNQYRNMSMKFGIGHGTIPTIVHGDMSYTAIDDINKYIHTEIYIVKVDCDTNPTPKILVDGEDESIKQIEAYLKDGVKTTIEIRTPLHDCTDQTE